MTSNPSLRTVLVAAVYQMRKLARDDDPFIFFYGDGAGAAILERSDAPGFIASAFAADGSYHRNWLIASGGTVEPATAESVQAGRTSVRMVERYPPEINDAGWPKLVRRQYTARTRSFRIGRSTRSSRAAAIRRCCG